MSRPRNGRFCPPGPRFGPEEEPGRLLLLLGALGLGLGLVELLGPGAGVLLLLLIGVAISVWVLSFRGLAGLCLRKGGPGRLPSQ